MQHPFDELIDQILRSKLTFELSSDTVLRRSALLDEMIGLIIRHAQPVEAVNVMANLICRTHACIGLVAGASLEDSSCNLHDVVNYLYPLVYAELKDTAQLLRPKGNA